MKEYIGIKIRFWTFEKLKPFYVQRLNEHNTYICKYHIKMVELLQGFNNMKIYNKGIHGRQCVLLWCLFGFHSWAMHGT
jgi:hypothetical protein